MMKRGINFLWLAFLFCLLPLYISAQRPANVKRSLSAYFENYKSDAYSSLEKTKVENVTIDAATRSLCIYLNEVFVGQPFTPQSVERIYKEVPAFLPAPYNTYRLTILAKGTPIERLIPLNLQPVPDSSRVYRAVPEVTPWVKPKSNPYSIPHGLTGRHLCLWASHGIYFNQKKLEWLWQRPRLYCTSEDLFTQSIVLPYLIPMLEQAGAVVYSPRDRDWQRNEVIVDNDMPPTTGVYSEANGHHHWESADTGFAARRRVYHEKENPFKDGTARMVKTTDDPEKVSRAVWTPNIPEAGNYAVYVSYKTLENSVDDATFCVRHCGVDTYYAVNQQMGGSTWVYLGTFYFNAADGENNFVSLSNLSHSKGVVTADAVRFGSGMGNVERYELTTAQPQVMQCSGMPRFLECARYYTQWAGLPYQVYSAKESADDYGDDINARPKAANYLSRGSFFNPGDSGLCVPIELSMGVHSDAGCRRDCTLIGTLGIYTSDFNDGVTSAGLSRLTSRDLVDIVMTNVTREMTQHLGHWNRRAMYDRNYGESREPMVPSMILETLSHQNWADLKLGHDPYFKFLLARSVYKGIAQYLSEVHGRQKTVIQPLPVKDMAASLTADGQCELSWTPQRDLADAAADATHYIIYTRAGENGYDNGTLTESTQCRIPLEAGKLYRFRVAALNDGGRSMLSDEVCAYYAGPEMPNLLLVDGFQRLAGPLPFDTDSTGGFDMSSDPGVIDNRMPCYCGYQLNFCKEGFGKEGPDGLGYSGSELEGKVLAGNTHDYCSRHAEDILAGGTYNISSCTSSAVGQLNLNAYAAMDLIMGAQKADGYSLRRYKTFTPELRSVVADFTQRGGSVLTSGAFIGCDMVSDDAECAFTANVLKYQYVGSLPLDSLNVIQGMNTAGTLYNEPNEDNYWIRRADILQGTGGAFSTMLYGGVNHSAAVAYSGEDYRALSFGFPLECIRETETRRGVLSAAIRFILNRP